MGRGHRENNTSKLDDDAKSIHLDLPIGTAYYIVNLKAIFKNAAMITK